MDKPIAIGEMLQIYQIIYDNLYSDVAWALPETRVLYIIKCSNLNIQAAATPASDISPDCPSWKKCATPSRDYGTAAQRRLTEFN